MPAETHVEQVPMDRKQVFELVRDRLADILEIDASLITESASFGDDLGADSLALIELVEAIEEELSERTVGFRIDDEDLEDLRIVRDAVDYCMAKLEESWNGVSPSGTQKRVRVNTSQTGDRKMFDLADRLGWVPADRALLVGSLSHRSWCAETGNAASNERLEFLGDSVLGLVVTNYLYRSYPLLPEGELAKVRASVVSSASLAEVAAGLDVGDGVLLGKGEAQSGGREKPSILADAMEALIGAVYLDQGWGTAEAVVLRLLEERIIEAAAGPGGRDFKTQFQEMCVHIFDELPTYSLTDEGPDHAKSFDASVSVDGVVRGRGSGRSKKLAEQAAAQSAWHAMMPDGAPDDAVSSLDAR